MMGSTYFLEALVARVCSAGPAGQPESHLVQHSVRAGHTSTCIVGDAQTQSTV